MREAARLVEQGISLELVSDMANALRNLASLADQDSRFSAYLRMHVQLPPDWRDARAADRVAWKIESERRAAGYQ